MNTKYLYATTDENYEDYSSGRVIYSATGATNFPVRLSSEVFQRCADYLAKKGKPGPYRVYDPFCGVAYSLTVIGFMHGSQMESLTGSDSDGRIVEFAAKNLSLLTKDGMEKRIAELKRYIEEYKKDSHREALKSAYRLQSLTNAFKEIKVSSFRLNALEEAGSQNAVSEVDIVITDLPYGKLTQWENAETEGNLMQLFLDKLKDKLNSTSVVAIICNKKQEISHIGYKVIAKSNLEKRRIILLEPEI
jgi:23S rRNA (guanine2535-N1)-methyltransferase